MTILTDEAKAAHAAAQTAAATAASDARKALRAAAIEAIRATLVRPDGTSLTLTQSGLAAVHSDLPNGLVVASDGAVSIAATLVDGMWSARLVTGKGSDWTPVSGPLRSLADLGRALAGA